MFFALRKENAKKARNGLILGIVIVPVIIGVAIISVGSAPFDDTEYSFDDIEDLEAMSCSELKSERLNELPYYQMSALAQDLEGTERYIALSEIIREKCE